MGSKVVTIEPDYSVWKGINQPSARISDKPIQVIFTWSKPKLERNKRYQTVTCCLLRQGVKVIGKGHAIENPHDEPNSLEGFHWAFKRAVKSMLYWLNYRKGAYYSESFRKRVDKAFRQALWEAMNGDN